VKLRMLVLLLAVTLLAGIAAAIVGCSGGSDDKAMFEKMATVWKDKDAAGAKQLFAADANVYWNWSPSVGTAEVTTGIDAISALVATGSMSYPTLHGDDVYAVDFPAGTTIASLSQNYQGAHFIAAWSRVSTQLYLVVLEVRDGKIQNQYVEAMY
jgi:hypothetical protein